jgi:hypothetical protein
MDAATVGEDTKSHLLHVEVDADLVGVRVIRLHEDVELLVSIEVVTGLDWHKETPAPSSGGIAP